jgi:ankyrin repeat protein
MTELAYKKLWRACMGIQEIFEHGYVEMAKIAIAEGADIEQRGGRGYTPLMMASNSNLKDIVKLLIEKGADLEAHTNGYTSLVIAATRGNYDVVKILLKAGANIETPLGKNALTLALEHENVECVKILLKSDKKK